MQITRWMTTDRLPSTLALVATLALVPAIAVAQAAAPAPAPAAAAAPAWQGTLDRIRSTGTLNLGYFAAAKPLSYKNPSGSADGFAVALCNGIADAVKTATGKPNLAVNYVAIDANPTAAVKDGRIDLMCAPMQPTLSRRAEVSFSIPVYAGGTGVLMRKDAPKAFVDLVEGRSTDNKPVWRGQPQLQILNQRKFVVIAGTTSERWATARKSELGVKSVITTVPNLAAGLAAVRDGRADGFLADRSVLLDLAYGDPSGKDLIVGSRHFDHTPMSLAMRRGDEEFRLLVDRALSKAFTGSGFDSLYGRYLGKPDAATRQWFREMAEPD